MTSTEAIAAPRQCDIDGIIDELPGERFVLERLASGIDTLLDVLLGAIDFLQSSS